VASGTVFMPTYMPTAGGRGCSTEEATGCLASSISVASLEQARVGSITGTPYGQARPASLDTGGTAPVKDVNVSVMPRLAGCRSRRARLLDGGQRGGCSDDVRALSLRSPILAPDPVTTPMT
jgi:type IV pilus assembly protein PilY1